MSVFRALKAALVNEVRICSVVVKIIFESLCLIFAALFTHPIARFINIVPAACNCNGHGQCQSIGNTYDMYKLNYDEYSPTYSPWESEQITMCICDPGFTGAACEFSKLHYISTAFNILLPLFCVLYLAPCREFLSTLRECNVHIYWFFCR